MSFFRYINMSLVFSSSVKITIIPLVVMLAIYAIGMAVGYHTPPIDSVGGDTFNDVTIFSFHFDENSNWERFINIAVNNCMAALCSIIFGTLTFGVLAAVHAFFNAFIWGHAIGFYSTYLTRSELLWSTVPHSGEILGMALAACTGFFISLNIFLPKYAQPFYHIICWGILSFSLIIISAFIESYVSMHL